MNRQWRIKHGMQFIATIAIYLAALVSLMREPSNNRLLTLWIQIVSLVLLLLVLPFHIMSAWVRPR
jgi:hypothetical protein